MAAGLKVTRLFLCCLLSEMCYSVAFPRVRGFAPSRPEQPHENPSFIQRPPEWKHYEDLQPKAYDQAPDPNWQNPQGTPRRLRNHGLQIQKKPSLHQPWMPHYARSHFHPNPTPPKPKQFEFNMKIPFLNFGLNKEPMKVSSGAGDHSPLYKPSSMEIQSSFNNPSSTGDVPKKGSNAPTGKQDLQNVPKPSFNFSLSLPFLPIPSIGQFPKPTKSDGGKVVPTKSPGSGLFTAKPSTQQGSTSPGHHSKHPGKVQHEHVYKPVETKPTHIHWLDHLHDHANRDKGPADQDSHAKVVLTPLVSKPLYQPVPSFSGPQTVSGSNTGRLKPTNHYVNIQMWPLPSAGSTDAFDPVHSPPASAFHHRDTFKPSTSYYGGFEREHPHLPVIPSGGYHQPHLHSSSGHGWKPETARPSSESHHVPDSTRSLYELLTSGRHNTAFYDGRGSGVESGPSDTSFWDHPNTENNEHEAPRHYHTMSPHLPNPQSPNIRHTPHNHGDMKPHHSRLFTGIDDGNSNTYSHPHHDGGLHRYILPQGTPHGYPFGLARHGVGGAYTGQPDPLPLPFLKPPLAATSWLHHQHQPTVYGFKPSTADYWTIGPGRVKYVIGYGPHKEPSPDNGHRRYVHPMYYN